MMLQTLQTLFNQLAGIYRHEAALRVKAHSIFGEKCVYPDALQTPACWRRKVRVIPHL
ncbi:MAG TPA: hypothetical protein PLW86_00660 [Rhodocyclaceae bacterium]|nr:hypothetical protein [Rhodocyclaceae bacterium]